MTDNPRTSPLANVHPDARIAPDVKIEAFTTVSKNVTIGAGSVIGPNVTIYENVEIGRNCRILPGTVLSGDASRLEFWAQSAPEDGLTASQLIIGDKVSIDSNVTMHGDIMIGDGTWIGSNVVVHDGARIDRNCKIFPGAVLSSIPQDLKFKGERTLLKVGENTTVREFATLNRGTDYNGETVVGSNCLIMAYAHVAHDCQIGDYVILANAVNMAGHVHIDDHAILGGMTAVHQFVRIGKHVMISGGSLVRKDVPPFITAAREPLQYEGVNTIGLRRRGFASEDIRNVQEIYRYVYGSGMNITQAIAVLETKVPKTKERTEIVRFLREGRRGVIKGNSLGNAAANNPEN